MMEEDPIHATEAQDEQVESSQYLVEQWLEEANLRLNNIRLGKKEALTVPPSYSFNVDNVSELVHPQLETDPRYEEIFSDILRYKREKSKTSEVMFETEESGSMFLDWNKEFFSALGALLLEIGARITRGEESIETPIGSVYRWYKNHKEMQQRELHNLIKKRKQLLGTAKENRVEGENLSSGGNSPRRMARHGQATPREGGKVGMEIVEQEIVVNENLLATLKAQPQEGTVLEAEIEAERDAGPTFVSSPLILERLKRYKRRDLSSSHSYRQLIKSSSDSLPAIDKTPPHDKPRPPTIASVPYLAPSKMPEIPRGTRGLRSTPGPPARPFSRGSDRTAQIYYEGSATTEESTMNKVWLAKRSEEAEEELFDITLKQKLSEWSQHRARLEEESTRRSESSRFSTQTLGTTHVKYNPAPFGEVSCSPYPRTRTAPPGARQFPPKSAEGSRPASGLTPTARTANEDEEDELMLSLNERQDINVFQQMSRPETAPSAGYLLSPYANKPVSLSSLSQGNLQSTQALGGTDPMAQSRGYLSPAHIPPSRLSQRPDSEVSRISTAPSRPHTSELGRLQAEEAELIKDSLSRTGTSHVDVFKALVSPEDQQFPDCVNALPRPGSGLMKDESRAKKSKGKGKKAKKKK
eukprot:GCRY01001973.1.p1 GENE.GCRY01001973.1~~GCRY01001973.1.p1  ORF type:complete len:640 (+),score=158.84 GCRY01001973.1:183-2102(+)